MEKVILSAPFGEYVSIPHTTPTLGTYTRGRRGWVLARLTRALASLRYYPSMRAWRHDLRLANHGIEELEAEIREARDNSKVANAILSVHGRCETEWMYVINKAASLGPLAVELNMTEPDYDEVNHYAMFSYATKRLGDRVIVKLPPTGYFGMVHAALLGGITSFHCCGSLPTPGGGLSGKPLKSLSLDCIQQVQLLASRASNGGFKLKRVIGGGGITAFEDAMDYLQAGATHVAVGSALLAPWRWAEVRKMACRLSDRLPPPRPGALRVTQVEQVDVA